VLTWFVRPPNEPDPSRSLDARGAVLLVAGVGALVTGLQQGPDWGWSSAATVACIVGEQRLAIGFSPFDAGLAIMPAGSPRSSSRRRSAGGGMTAAAATLRSASGRR
jgi:hypothetical protein